MTFRNLLADPTIGRYKHKAISHPVPEPSVGYHVCFQLYNRNLLGSNFSFHPLCQQWIIIKSTFIAKKRRNANLRNLFCFAHYCRINSFYPRFDLNLIFI